MKTLVIPPRLVIDLVVTTRFCLGRIPFFYRRVSKKLPFSGKLTKEDIILGSYLSDRERGRRLKAAARFFQKEKRSSKARERVE